MVSWAQNKNLAYLIPREKAYFAKLALAIAMHEIDEDVIDRQRAGWIDDLYAMSSAQAPPSSPSESGIQLPAGVHLSGSTQET